MVLIEYFLFCPFGDLTRLTPRNRTPAEGKEGDEEFEDYVEAIASLGTTTNEVLYEQSFGRAAMLSPSAFPHRSCSGQEPHGRLRGRTPFEEPCVPRGIAVV